MEDKVTLSFSEISRRLKNLTLPPIDRVVGVATGGIVPASMLAHQLHKPLSLLHISFRDPANSPRYDQPILLHDLPLSAKKQRILLVDDVSVSGATLQLAKAQLSEHQVTTLVLKGKADYVLFPEVTACVKWPWKPEIKESADFVVDN
jgi:hypoxanthine phosphoribosyltransferase